ncbi:hypothetical protein A2G07_15800 (plasmid) [Deinococcus radiodurans R1 = ATCC 13939 = DSM 20539]|nr:hypothetical protein A2G07_15800 [Deinococcus radiodurans R1 = ATCC 13939 = DSM 20539]
MIAASLNHPVQTQQDLPRWKMDDEQSDEKAHVQLLIRKVRSARLFLPCGVLIPGIWALRS